MTLSAWSTFHHWLRLHWQPPRRIPVIYQMSAGDCGAACLTMVLRYWGYPATLDGCRSLVGGGQQGTTALMIAQAARSLGCQTYAYRLNTAQTDALAQLPTPALLHWHGDHFVVLERWTPHQVQIIDPAVGRRVLSPAAFAEGFSGLVLALIPPAIWPAPPAATTAPAPSITHTLRWLASTPGLPRLVAQILLASLLLQLGGLLLPFATSVIVDRIVPGGAAAPMMAFGLGLLLLALSQLVLHYLRTLLVTTLQMRLDAQLMLTFFHRLLSLPYRFFQERSSGDLLLRLESNRTLRDLLTTGLLTALLDGLLALFYLLALLLWIPRFGLVVVTAAALQWLTLAVTQRRIHEESRQLLLLQSDEESFLVETLQSIEQVKASGAESWLYTQYATRFWRTLGMSLRQSTTEAMVNLALHTVQWLTPLLLLWLGSYAILAGEISTGDLLAYVLLASSCLTALAGLASGIQQWQPVRAHLQRLLEVIHAAPEERTATGDLDTTSPTIPLHIPHTSSPAAASPPLTGTIEVRNVTFRYAPHQPPILHNLSLTIAPGETVALMGSTGAGKSTLLRLILGLYLPTEGEILYAGRPLAGWDLRQYRRRFGVVLQNAHLINGTVAENIAYHHPTLSQEAIIRAAQLAAIHDEIITWPMGYQTRIAEGGSALSGGQRQRIALARALAHEPSILLLDEATSHLDPHTAQRILQNLSALDCTRLMVTHQLAPACPPDRVVVLEAGRIVADGSG